MIQAGTERLLELLEHQYQDYRAMYRVSLDQRAFLAREDVSGLQATFHQMHDIMGRIRLRQSEVPPSLPEAEAILPEVAERSGAIRQLIRDLLAIRRDNEGSVRRLMDRARAELKQFQQGRQASRVYQSHTVTEARFYDDRR